MLDFPGVPSLKLTAKAPENRPSQKERIIFQPTIFRCELLAFFSHPKLLDDIKG